MKHSLHFACKIALFLLFILFCLSITHAFFPGDEWMTVSLILLTIASVLLLPDLLAVWLLLLATVVLVMIMVFGLSFIPVSERFFFALLLPTIGLYCLWLLRISRLLFVESEIESAQKWYLQRDSEETNQRGIKLLMVRWAHFEQFREINAKECQQILSQVKDRLSKHPCMEKVFTLQDGSFLVVASDEEVLHGKNEIKDLLRELTFNKGTSRHAVQFQIAQEDIRMGGEQEKSFNELLKGLNRKLETEIIVEY